MILHFARKDGAIPSRSAKPTEGLGRYSEQKRGWAASVTMTRWQKTPNAKTLPEMVVNNRGMVKCPTGGVFNFFPICCEWGRKTKQSSIKRNARNQTKRMKLNELYPSKYLSADDIDGEVVGTIKRIEIEEMKDNEGNSQEKPVLYFRGVEKGMVLNKTNGTRIAGIHGDETDLWIGKNITLVKEMVDAFGKSSWAIRVKPTPPPAKNKPAFQPANDEAEDGSFETANPVQA